MNRRFKMLLIFAKRVWAIAGLLSIAIPLPGQTATSASYELDYAVVGAASAATGSTHQSYEITGLVTMEGLSGGVSATLNGEYEVSPLIGEAVEHNSSVKFWSLY